MQKQFSWKRVYVCMDKIPPPPQKKKKKKKKKEKEEEEIYILEENNSRCSVSTKIPE